jgi:hypothetical protein
VVQWNRHNALDAAHTWFRQRLAQMAAELGGSGAEDAVFARG